MYLLQGPTNTHIETKALCVIKVIPSSSANPRLQNAATSLKLFATGIYVQKGGSIWVPKT